MLPEHFRKEVLVRCGAGGGDGGRNHLTASAAYGEVRFVGEMAAEVRPVDERSLRVGSAHEFLVGPQMSA